MRISACSIVKNEAHNIAKSIESYKDAVDEIIIVDTGSTDNTIEICESYGAKVFHFDWINDFSAAKNYALEQAKGDWIVFLDADEFFVPDMKTAKVREMLEELLPRTEVDSIRATLCNYDENRDFISSRILAMRIFRNSPSIRYVGKIHEYVDKKEAQLTYVEYEGVKIYHTGYSNGRVELKSKRNLEFLREAYRSGDKDAPLYYYLCRENFLTENYDDCVRFYKKFLSHPDFDKLMTVNNLFISVYEYYYRMMALLPQKYTQKDIDKHVEHTLEKHPAQPIYNYYKGVEAMKKDYNAANKAILKAIHIHNNYKEQYVNSFSGSLPEAYYRLGHISLTSGNIEEAFEYHLKALQIGPLYCDALSELLKIIEDQSAEEIILFLNSIYNIEDQEEVQTIISALKRTRLYKVFLYYAVKYNNNFDGQDDTTYAAMLLSGNYQKLIDTATSAFENSGNEEHRRYIGLAVLFEKDRKLFNLYKDRLNPYQAIVIQTVLDGIRLNNISDQIASEYIWLYKKMFFIARQEQIDCLEVAIEPLNDSICGQIISCYMDLRDYKLAMDKAKWLIETGVSEFFTAQMHKIKAFMHYHLSEFEQALEEFEIALSSKTIDIDYNAIIYITLIAQRNSGNAVGQKAEQMLTTYKSVFDEYKVAKDIVRTGKFEQAEAEVTSQYLRDMTEQEFVALTYLFDYRLPDEVLETYFLLADSLVGKNMDIQAFTLLLQLIKNEYKKDIIYFRLGEVFNRAGNAQVALFCHTAVFRINPTFAELAITDKNNENRYYVFDKDMKNEDIGTCPICGAEAQMHSVYNALTGNDFIEQCGPIKIWRKCNNCNHLFSSYICDAKFKEVDRSDKHDARDYADVVESILNHSAGNNMAAINTECSFIAAAQEYGMEVTNDVFDVNKCIFKTKDKFDIIAVSSVLESAINPERLIQKLVQQLNADGCIYIETPNMLSGYARLAKDKDIHMRSSRINNYFSKDSLEKLLVKCGFVPKHYKMSRYKEGFMEVISVKK